MNVHRPLLLTALAGLLLAPGLSAQEIEARSGSIRFGGRLHAQYAGSSVGAGTDGFFLRRARFEADIDLNDFIDGRLQVEYAGGEVGLRDAWMRMNFSPLFALSVGQLKRAFDIFELDSSTELGVIERDGRVGGVDACAGVGGVCSFSRFTEKLAYSDRDVGVRAAGGQGRLSYEVSVTNGAGANKSDENDAKSFAGRLAFEVVDGVEVGGQVSIHDYPGEEDDDRHASSWSADVQVGQHRDGFLLQAALVGGDNWKNLDTAGEPTAFLSGQAIATWFAPLSGARVTAVEPLLRVTWGDPDTDLDDDGGLVFTPGVLAYFGGRNRIGLNLDVWSPQDGDTEYSIKVQTFLYF